MRRYVVIDLEWNQAMSAKSSIYNKLPIHLLGEIIQIGAVKLRDDLTPGDEFQIDIRPVYFRRMHHKVKKLTGFDSERLKNGVSFTEAMKQFRAWCGDDCTFLTWGYDDKGIMEQNIIIHDLDWDWIAGWVNLQIIYNCQTEGDKNQKSLSTAMEHFGIEQTRTAHDALGDAFNTALVCSKLDLETGMKQYNAASRALSLEVAKPDADGMIMPPPLQHVTFTGYGSKSEALSDKGIPNFVCPDCGRAMKSTRWVGQGDRRYMSLIFCEEHGAFLSRLKFKKADDGMWSVNRIIYRANSGLRELYREKAALAHKKRRRRSKK